MTTPPGIEDLISRMDAAKLIGVHVNTIDREVRKAGLRRFRRRGDSRIFFLRDEIATLDPIVEITEETS